MKIRVDSDLADRRLCQRTMDDHARVNRNADAAAVVLAGGRSSRMGSDKALLRFQGRALIEILVSQAAAVTDEVWVSANDAGPYRFLGLPVIPDALPGQGPLSGIHAAMTETRRELLIVLACDLPLVREPLIRSLLHHAGGHDAVIPITTDGRSHPLCGVYRRTCLPAIQEGLEKGQNKIRALFEPGTTLRVNWLTGPAGGFRDQDLLNLNYPRQLSDLSPKFD